MSLRIPIFYLILSLAGCTSNDYSRSSPTTRPGRDRASAEKSTALTGTLQSGMAAIGGEHTGWVLVGDNESGGIEVDVSRVPDKARAADGQRVTITGRMVQRNYVERGQVPVLVAERIVDAPPPGQGRATGGLESR